METISDRLAQLRRDARLSLRGFVDAVEERTGTRVLHDSARRYESGETRIPADYVVAVCRAFAVSAEWLLLGTQPLGPSQRSAIAEALDEVWAIISRTQAFEGRPPARDPLTSVLDEWRRFTEGLPPKHLLRDAIIASWGPSPDTGVDPVDDEAKRRSIPDSELERRRGALRALLEAAEPHMAWLSAAIGHLPHVVYLVCTDGIVVHAVESKEDLLVRWGLWPGADWSNGAIGTNPTGTALESGKVVAVLGPEHHMRSAREFTCLAAPIRGPRGAIVGALDLSTAFHAWRPYQLVFVAYAAEMIGRDLSRLLE
jgi:hypothetical protein